MRAGRLLGCSQWSEASGAACPPLPSRLPTHLTGTSTRPKFDRDPSHKPDLLFALIFASRAIDVSPAYF